MIDKAEVSGYSTSFIGVILTTIQNDPTAQLILFCVNISLALLTFIYTMVKLIKLCKKDGVIDEEEKKKIHHTFKEGLLNILFKIKSIFKGGNNKNGNNNKNQSDD